MLIHQNQNQLQMRIATSNTDFILICISYIKIIKVDSDYHYQDLDQWQNRISHVYPFFIAYL